VVDHGLDLVAVDHLLEAQAPTIRGGIALDVRFRRLRRENRVQCLRGERRAFLVGE
jgi:hypothetical protein